MGEHGLIFFSRNRIPKAVSVLVLVFSWILVWPLFNASAAAAESLGPTVEQVYPRLATDTLKTAILSDLPEGVVLTTEPIQITEPAIRSVVDQYDPKLRGQFEKNLFYLLELEALKRILLEEGKASSVDMKGLSENEAIGRLLEKVSEAAEVSNEEVKEFYESNREMMGEAAFDEVKAPIREVLLERKQGELVASYLEGLGRGRVIRINRRWVEAQNVLSMDNPVDRARDSGTPALVEFGASGCVPCDMMQPVLAKIRKSYGPKLNVLFVHVREEQVLGARYGIRSIPVQVFYDADGREVFRHEGFYPEDQVRKVLTRMGVE